MKLQNLSNHKYKTMFSLVRGILLNFIQKVVLLIFVLLTKLESSQLNLWKKILTKQV